jgi:phosphoglycerate dehydrogenase-like enzyme
MMILTKERKLVKKLIEGVKMVDFHQLVEKSDYITIHTHLSEETDHIFTRDIFKKMKNQLF